MNGNGGGFYVTWASLWAILTGWVATAGVLTGAYFWAERIADRIEKPTATIIQYAQEKEKLDERWLELDTTEHKQHREALEQLNVSMQSKFWQMENKLDRFNNVFTGQINDLNFRLGQCIEGHDGNEIKELKGQIEKLKIMMYVEQNKK